MRSDNQMPLYVLSIQERAEQLASQFEGKPVAQEVTLTHRSHWRHLSRLCLYVSTI